MGIENVLFGLALLVGVYMAWSIGANDVANAMGTSVGSGALTLRRAVIVAAVLEFSGAFFVGSHVSDTVRKGIVNPEIFTAQPMFLAYGMIAALLAAGAWLQLASYSGWPVSTTHSIVGAMIGFGLVVGGAKAIYWKEVGPIVASWVITPVMGGVIAYGLFRILRRQIFYKPHPAEEARKLLPWMVFFVFFILTLATVFKGLKNLKLDLPLTQAIGVAAILGLLTSLVSAVLVRRIKITRGAEKKRDMQSPQVLSSLAKAIKHLELVKANAVGEINYQATRLFDEVTMLAKTAQTETEPDDGSDEIKTVERIFVYLQILSACFVAFAHGANDVANAIGPLASAVDVLQSGRVALETTVPEWMLALGGIGIIIGLATWGWRVIETIGRRITELTPTRGFCAEFGAATTIVLASKLGLPVSTTHTLVGAVIGVGLARGLGAINLRIMRDIFASWVVTIPAGAILAVLFFYVLRAIFG